MQQHIDTVTTIGGSAVAGASVLVKTYPAGTTATIYSDDGVTTQTNPITTNALGRFAFYAEDGRYSLVISKTGVISQLTLTDSVLLLDPDDGEASIDSTDVFFTQSGTGALSRTVNAKLREWIDTDDYSTNANAVTAGGSDIPSGFFADLSGKIKRTGKRVFVGEAAQVTGNLSGSQGSIFPTSTEGANWILRDAQLLSIADTGLIAVAGVARSSDQNSTPTECIGISGFAVNDKASGRAWGAYFEVQHESGATASQGIEIDTKNKGSDVTSTTYSRQNSAKGITIVAGGDASYGGSPANPSDVAIGIIANASTWNKGIVFFADSLTGDDGTTGTGVAIEMAKGHRVTWMAPGGIAGAEIRSDVASASSNVTQLFEDNTVSWIGTGGDKILFVVNRNGVSAGGNYIRVNATNAGAGPFLDALGADTNVPFRYRTQGTGAHQFETGSSGNEQLRITNTASADRYVTITGANAGNPAIGTNAGNLSLTTNIVLFTGSANVLNGTAIPAGGTAGSGLKFSSTTNFGVFFGSGAPTLAAAKGSLYLRSNGTGATDRAYINTDGSTTWTALTTVA